MTPAKPRPTEQCCPACGQVKPYTSDYFRSYYRTNQGTVGECLTLRCLECIATGKRGTNDAYGRPPRDGITFEQIVSTRDQMRLETGSDVSWVLVAQRLNRTPALIYKRLNEAQRAGLFPRTKLIAKRQRSRKPREIVNRLRTQLDTLQIGDPRQDIVERVAMALKTTENALAHEKRAMLALVASRQENAQLRAEIRELQRQQEKLWQVRDGYRKAYELPAPDYRTADDGWQLAGD